MLSTPYDFSAPPIVRVFVPAVDSDSALQGLDTIWVLGDPLGQLMNYCLTHASTLSVTIPAFSRRSINPRGVNVGSGESRRSSNTSRGQADRQELAESGDHEWTLERLFHRQQRTNVVTTVQFNHT
jgi:hypothetical protein